MFESIKVILFQTDWTKYSKTVYASRLCGLGSKFRMTDMRNVSAGHTNIWQRQCISFRRRLRTELIDPKGMPQLISLCPNSAVNSGINLEEYLSDGLGIVSRLPDQKIKTEIFVTQGVARDMGHKALTAFVELGSVCCGEKIHELMSLVSEDYEGLERRLSAATRSHIGRHLCIRFSDIFREAIAEYKAMKTVFSIDDALQYLSSRFVGDGRLFSLAKLILRTGDFLEEDSRNVYVIKEELCASLASFSFLWRDARKEARRLLGIAKDVFNETPNFWETVDRLSKKITKPRIALDAIVATHMAELGIIVNCHMEGLSSLKAIAERNRDHCIYNWQPVTLTNSGRGWLTPFRALTNEREMMALDGETRLLVDNEPWGFGDVLGLSEKSSSTENRFVLCEPLPYKHIDKIKGTTPKVFAALAREGEEWNDGLETRLKNLASNGTPLYGEEVAAAVRAARENYLQNNDLAADYADLIFSVQAIVNVFTSAVEQGRRMGEELYESALLLVHPDISKIGNMTVRKAWENLEEIPSIQRRFLENVRHSYNKSVIYTSECSADVQHIRPKRTDHYRVWYSLAHSWKILDASNISAA